MRQRTAFWTIYGYNIGYRIPEKKDREMFNWDICQLSLSVMSHNALAEIRNLDNIWKQYLRIEFIIHLNQDKWSIFQPNHLSPSNIRPYSIF